MSVVVIRPNKWKKSSKTQGIVERNFYPKNGDVVVALLDNTYATLKKYYREKNRIRLQPANKAMKPIYDKNPAIQGIVKAIMRTFL